MTTTPRVLFAHATMLMLLVASTSHAQANRIITRCTGIKGYTYIAEGGLVSEDAAGWQEDGITNGSFLLTQIGNDYDIIFVDAANRSVSSREDGGHVLAVKDVTGALMLLVVYERNVETWTFKIDRTGHGTVMMNQNRFDSPIEKYALMRATCSR